MDKFNENKLKELSDNIIVHSQFGHYLTIIFYFRNLPLKMYQELLYKDINMIDYISTRTKNYDEIKQIYKYLII